MARPLFSTMLYDRRRQLGLSIKQASNVLRLKEEVLVAFEEGDFDSIPKSGYAQGMLSSYARYLGLNAKTVVNQFSQDLFEHEKGAGSHEARRNRRRLNRDDDGPLYETPQANVGGSSSRRTYVESHGFLPTSGGFAGDMGEFATTSPARPRYRSSGADDMDEAYDYPQGRPYTSRVPMSGGMTPLIQVQRQRSRLRSDEYGAQDSFGAGRSYASAYDMSDPVTTRRVTPSQYRDDMRLDNAGGSYETASSTVGRRSSRNIASTQRPNVSRRSSRTSRDQLNRRERGQSYGGIVGMLSDFFSDRGRVMALIIVMLGLLLTLTIILSVRSCINAQQSTGRSVTVTSAESEAKKTEKDDEMTDEEERLAREKAAAEKAAESESTATERTFEVTVDEGGVTWLEVEYDGKSDIAETVTGPWDRTYTVRKSISINVNDTTAVTVTEGGKKLEFDSKASGIGTITIQVSKNGDEPEKTDDGTGTTEGEGTQGEADASQNVTQDGQTQGQQGDGSQQQVVTNQQQGTDGSAAQTGTGTGATGSSPYEGYTLDSDGYYYGADGYYDANGNFYQY